MSRGLELRVRAKRECISAGRHVAVPQSLDALHRDLLSLLGVFRLGGPGSILANQRLVLSVLSRISQSEARRQRCERKRILRLTQCPFKVLGMARELAPRAASSPETGSPPPTSVWLQVVKPHTPLIRFPDRRDNPKPNVSEVLRSAGLPSHSSSISQHSKGSKSPDWLMHQGPPDTAEIIKTLPQKYRRKLVSQEEMEFIQRGGPE
ncbi:alpha-ketoglutarate dehydrogenase component 4 isoform X1 [Hippopotamus amphibius kiboko]|uniref:alpha-ketoglutarate dehydrogenase component 4 isoform X1 n=1 Tax=Hippopotamus amphibius kiboko TaxID=575201 RepID=UPI002592841B|nr:alpha-ketoglutarate dehydrogenase component 4 isoform X1 [Hippopotamus amphibius kiboko]